MIREMCDHLAEDLIDRWIMTVEPSLIQVRIKKKKKNSLLDSLFSSEPLASKTNELTTYNDMPIADKNANILQWWKDHEAQLPRLGKSILFDLTFFSYPRKAVPRDYEPFGAL